MQEMREMSSWLLFLCANSNNTAISRMLKHNNYRNIDVLYDNGIFFKSAISHNNPGLLKIFLDYMYGRKEIEQEPRDNHTEQSIRYKQLQEILQVCKKEYSISDEIEEIINHYVCLTEDDIDEEEQDLAGFDMGDEEEVSPSCLFF